MNARNRARLRWMFPQLKMRTDDSPASSRPLTLEERRWTVRDQPRTRATFALPHPADFPGGLPAPSEYPRR